MSATDHDPWELEPIETSPEERERAKEFGEFIASAMRVQALDALGIPWGPARYPWPATKGPLDP